MEIGPCPEKAAAPDQTGPRPGATSGISSDAPHRFKVPAPDAPGGVTMEATPENSQDLARSFVAVRQAIGYLGAFLPLSLIVLGAAQGTLAPSISDSYYTPARDLFVGTLVGLGVFLVAYTGHRRKGDERISDSALATTAGLAVLGVAFIPTTAPAREALPAVHGWIGPGLAASLHYASAALFFLCMARFCLVHFRRSPKMDRAHIVAKRIYAQCGYAILGAVALMAACAVFTATTGSTLVGDWALIFVLETVGVLAFAVAWLVKGETLRGAIEKIADRKDGSKEPPRQQPVLVEIAERR